MDQLSNFDQTFSTV